VPKSSTKSTKKTKTVPYDVADQLRTPDEMAAYLDAWLAEAPDDTAGIARALGDIARAKGMSQVARDAGLSRESLYKALGPTEIPASRPFSRSRARSECASTLKQLDAQHRAARPHMSTRRTPRVSARRKPRIGLALAAARRAAGRMWA